MRTLYSDNTNFFQHAPPASPSAQKKVNSSSFFKEAKYSRNASTLVAAARLLREFRVRR